MNNFDYYNPVKILFGTDKIEQLKTHLDGFSKILITYGKGSIKQNGTYTRVVQSLQGIRSVEFGGIEANPKYEYLMEAVKLARNEKIDFILAIGGGSVIDGTKFIAAAIPYSDNDPWDILSKGKKIRKAIPFGTILTLPATGSEMNSGAVISRLSTKEKLAFGSPLLYPKFSILDPTLTYSLPKHQIANGITDAFAHVLEQYLTYPSDAPLQDRFAESILQTLIEIGPLTLQHPSNYSYRANFMWCCTMALNGLIASGVPTDWATHMIGHELTAYFGIDHGATLAILYPALLRETIREKEEKLLLLGKNVWKLQPENLSAAKSIEALENFFRSLGMKTKLSEWDIPANMLSPIINRFKSRGWKLGENKSLTPDRIEKILLNAL